MKHLVVAALAQLLWLGSWTNTLAEEWTQFRGPGGQGHSTVKRLPLEWNNDSDNVRWKSPIVGLGWSSPVVLGDRIWLTTSVEGTTFHLVCLDLETGKQIYNVEVFKRAEPLKIHRKNSHASPTPIIHGNRVYVHFGTYGTACLELDGDIVWKKQVEYRHVHGPGGSPVVFDNLLIFSCDGGDRQFVIALDCETGNERWRTDRPSHLSGKKFAFSTPLLATVAGKTQLISPGAGAVVAYDPQSGTELWYSDYPGGYSVIPRPVMDGGLVYVSSSYDRPKLFAIRVGGSGDVTDSNVEWTLDKGAPHSSSFIVVNGNLYVISDRGIATCVDAVTGEQHWQERIGGNYSASLLHAAGRIYFLDEQGKTTVIQPGRDFHQLAVNEVEGRTLSSLTPVEGALLLRTDKELWRIDAD